MSLILKFVDEFFYIADTGVEVGLGLVPLIVNLFVLFSYCLPLFIEESIQQRHYFLHVHGGVLLFVRTFFASQSMPLRASVFRTKVDSRQIVLVA